MLQRLEQQRKEIDWEEREIKGQHAFSQVLAALQRTAATHPKEKTIVAEGIKNLRDTLFWQVSEVERKRKEFEVLSQPIPSTAQLLAPPLFLKEISGWKLSGRQADMPDWVNLISEKHSGILVGKLLLRPRTVEPSLPLLQELARNTGTLQSTQGLDDYIKSLPLSRQSRNDGAWFDGYNAYMVPTSIPGFTLTIRPNMHQSTQQDSRRRITGEFSIQSVVTAVDAELAIR